MTYSIKFPLIDKLKLFRNGMFKQQASTIVPPTSVSSSSPKATRNALNVRIDDNWYDLSGWRKAHPAGEHWIDMYNNRDATEVMQGFHSDDSLKMLQRLPKSKAPEELQKMTPEVTTVSRNFRALRKKLVEEGWWKRDYFHEARLLAIWAGLFLTGLTVARSNPWLGLGLLTLANTNAGWLGHDYIHGVDKFGHSLRNFAAFTAGMSPTWWSDKHNKHHAVPNEWGVDEDLDTEPVLHVLPPNTSKDHPLRKFQHIYLPLAFSLMFLVWRIDSMKVCINDAKNGFKRKTQWELALQLAHYGVLAAFVPIPVIVGHVFLSGLISAIIVTVTHQSEDLFFEFNPDFVLAQFQSTRNAECQTVFSDWLWGGMQWQLEHHLFPSMPRSRYPAVAKVVKQFAAENNIEYRTMDEFKLIKKNWDLYKLVAESPSAPDGASRAFA